MFTLQVRCRVKVKGDVLEFALVCRVKREWLMTQNIVTRELKGVRIKRSSDLADKSY